MKSITVFDPPMCCSTGVCGPSPNQELVRFGADLNQLAKGGIAVRRLNLAQEPEAFVQQQEVRRLLTERGPGVLPVILVNGRIRFTGRYPTREELQTWLAQEEEA